MYVSIGTFVLFCSWLKYTGDRQDKTHFLYIPEVILNHFNSINNCFHTLTHTHTHKQVDKNNWYSDMRCIEECRKIMQKRFKLHINYTPMPPGDIFPHEICQTLFTLSISRDTVVQKFRLSTKALAEATSMWASSTIIHPLPHFSFASPAK